MRKQFRLGIMSGAAMALLALAPAQAKAQNYGNISQDVLNAPQFYLSERLLRDALMNVRCPEARQHFDALIALTARGAEIASTGEHRERIDEWRSKIDYYRPLVAECGEEGFSVPWPVGEPTLVSPRTLSGDYMGIDGGDTDVVDRDLRRLGGYARSGECDRFWSEVARLRELGLNYEQDYEFDRLVREGCPPGVTSPPTQSAPDADDTADIFDDPDSGLRSEGLAPQERTPVTAPSTPPPAEPQSGPAPAAIPDTQPPPPPDRSLGAWHVLTDILFGAGRADVPQTGIGVTRSGPSGAFPETFAERTRDKISTIGIGGSVSFGCGGIRARSGDAEESPLGCGGIRVRGGYAEGDASTTFDVQPISGGFNGSVFGALSPAGSSGTGAGSVTVVGTTEVDLSQFGLGIDLAVARPTPSTRIFLAFDYSRASWRYDLSLVGTVSTVQFSQERDQRVRDNAFGVGIGVESVVPLSSRRDGGAALSARIIAVAQGYHLDSNLRSTERNVSNFGPSSDRDFTIEIEDGDNGFGVAATAGAELDFVVSPGVSLFAGGTATYRSRVGAMFNPNSGDQVFFDGLTTAHRNDDFWSYGARVGIRIGLR